MNIIQAINEWADAMEMVASMVSIRICASMEKCAKTVRTGETVAEYRKMSKMEQDNRKDVGGFVAGALVNGIRKNGYVEARSMLTLDIDHATEGIWDEITMLLDYKCLMYSTHKYTKDEPRVRLMLWLDNITGCII